MITSTHYCLLIRHTPRHAVIAHVRMIRLGDGEAHELLRLTPDAGEVPDMTSLCGRTFPSRKDLRKAIVSAMGRPRSGNR